MEQTTEEKLAEALKQLAASQAQAKQAEQALASERDLRGKSEQQLKDANLLVDQLNQAASEATPERKVPTVTLGSGTTTKKYRVVVPQFNLPGVGVLKAEDVKSNSAELKKLVELGSGVVEEVK